MILMKELLPVIKAWRCLQQGKQHGPKKIYNSASEKYATSERINVKGSMKKACHELSIMGKNYCLCSCKSTDVTYRFSRAL